MATLPRTEQLRKIGKSIKQRREDLRILQKDLATAVDVEKSTLSQYESGQIDIPIMRLIAIADYLRTTVSALIDDRTSPDSTERQVVGNTPDARAGIWLSYADATGQTIGVSDEFVGAIRTLVLSELKALLDKADRLKPPITTDYSMNA